MWKSILDDTLSPLGGLRFLLKCDYNVDKLPVQLPMFYVELLNAWKLVSIPNYNIVWNNQAINIDNKTICWNEFVEKNIVSVSDVIGADGLPFSFEAMRIRGIERINFIKWYGLVNLVRV